MNQGRFDVMTNDFTSRVRPASVTYRTHKNRERNPIRPVSVYGLISRVNRQGSNFHRYPSAWTEDASDAGRRIFSSVRARRIAAERSVLGQKKVVNILYTGETGEWPASEQVAIWPRITPALRRVPPTDTEWIHFTQSVTGSELYRSETHVFKETRHSDTFDLRFRFLSITNGKPNHGRLWWFFVIYFVYYNYQLSLVCTPHGNLLMNNCHGVLLNNWFDHDAASWFTTKYTHCKRRRMALSRGDCCLLFLSKYT